MSKTKIALIGVGNQGQVHLEALQELVLNNQASIAGVCDFDEVKLSNINESYPEVKVYKDYKELVDTEKPNLAIICLPNSSYGKAIEYCFKNGVGVLKEKPLAIKYEEGLQLYELAQKQKCILKVAQQRFFHPHYKKAKSFLNFIGEINFMDYIFTLNDKKNSWYWQKEYGGGNWYGLGWHACSVIHFFLGQPNQISLRWISSGKRQFSYDTEDTSILFCNFSKGCIATSFTSVVSPLKSESVFLQGKQGSIKLTRKEIVLFDNDGNIIESDCTEFDSKRSYVEQIENFIQSYQEKSDGKDFSLGVMKMIEAGILSATQNGLPVEVESLKLSYSKNDDENLIPATLSINNFI